MARKKADQKPEWAQRLSTLHDKAGSPSYADIAYEIRSKFGYKVSDELIRRAHRGQINVDTCASELLAALVDYYGIKAVDLGESVAHRLEVALTVTGMVSVREPIAA